jgi:hypothetical protein
MTRLAVLRCCVRFRCYSVVRLCCYSVVRLYCPISCEKPNNPVQKGTSKIQQPSAHDIPPPFPPFQCWRQRESISRKTKKTLQGPGENKSGALSHLRTNIALGLGVGGSSFSHGVGRLATCYPQHTTPSLHTQLVILPIVSCTHYLHDCLQAGNMLSSTHHTFTPHATYKVDSAYCIMHSLSTRLSVLC